MQTNSSATQHLLLFRGPDWDRGLAPDAAQRLLDDVMAWFDGLGQRGLVKAGQPLAREGAVLSGKTARRFDGPFAESKEAIGGYFLLNVETLDEAIAIAKQCPILEYGAMVEVRPIAAQCPTMQRVSEALADATA